MLVWPSFFFFYTFFSIFLYFLLTLSKTTPKPTRTAAAATTRTTTSTAATTTGNQMNVFAENATLFYLGLICTNISTSFSDASFVASSSSLNTATK